MQYESEHIEYKSQMIKDAEGDHFEDLRCLKQNLTFQAVQDAFGRYGIEFSKEKYRA